MAKVYFKRNPQQVKELLTSPDVRALVTELGTSVQNAAGEGYELEVSDTGQRVKATVKTATPEAMIDNSRNNTLLKALGGASA